MNEEVLNQTIYPFFHSSLFFKLKYIAEFVVSKAFDEFMQAQARQGFVQCVQMLILLSVKFIVCFYLS